MGSVSNDFNKSLTEKWKKLQLELREKLILSDTESWAEDIDRIELIGGMDISYDKNDNSKGCVASVVLDAKNDFNILYKHLNNITISNPYVAGFLAFREVHFLVEEFQLLKQNKPELLPNVWLIDGNGLLHARQFGLASHFGVLADCPAIGVAKNPYYFNVIDKTVKDDHKRELLKLEKVGDSIPVYSSDKQVIGVALKTRDNCKNPVYVSIGNRVSLNTAINVVLKCCKYKVPEPIRRADFLSRKQLIN